MSWWSDAPEVTGIREVVANKPDGYGDSRTVNGITYTAVRDPDSKVFKFYMTTSDPKNYYFVDTDGSLYPMNVDRYYEYQRYYELSRAKGSRVMSPKEFMASRGGKKKRRSTKSRPRRSTRSRKVTLRRR